MERGSAVFTSEHRNCVVGIRESDVRMGRERPFLSSDVALPYRGYLWAAANNCRATVRLSRFNLSSRAVASPAAVTGWITEPRRTK